MPEEPSEEDGARAEFEAMAERLRETVARRKAARVGIHRFRVISGKKRGGRGGFDESGPGLEPAPVRPNNPSNLSGGAEAPLDP